MTNKVTSTERRRFLEIATKNVLAVPLGVLVINRSAMAEPLAPLDEQDPLAKSLSYVHDAKTSSHATYQEGRNCSNCNLIQDSEGEWRRCSIINGKAVNQNGWCLAWVGKT